MPSADRKFALVTRSNSLMILLLNACIRKLQEQGVKRLFLDAVTSNVDAFKLLSKLFQNDRQRAEASRSKQVPKTSGSDIRETL
jgi:hypothetical protein